MIESTASTTTNSALHPALIEALRVDREALNRRFALRQRTGFRIDDIEFQSHLRTTINSLVAAVADAFPERVRAVVNGLFDVSLDLFSAGLLGEKTKHPYVNAAWREVLPYATRLLARDPVRVAGCVSNAADHLASQMSTRTAEWLIAMRELATQCDSVSRWLDAGKVAAWRVGLVQYRAAALRIARELPQALAARAIGVGDSLTKNDWGKLLTRLESDRWFWPSSNSLTTTEGDIGQRTSIGELRIVRTAGGFRGFGGPCLRPPQVVATCGSLFVSDGDANWQLLADACGTFWQRVSEVPAPAAEEPAATIDARGQVRWDHENVTLAELSRASSFACDGQTLAVALPTSHYVFLVARAS